MTKKKQVGVRFDSNRTRLKTGETQRPNGTYAYRWSTPDGKRHSIYAPTLEKLREQEEQIIVDKHDGIRSDVKSITVNEMFNLWCQLKRGIKDSTFKNYIYMYELFVKPSFGKNRLVQVKKSDVRKFYNSLADGKVLKIATIDNVHNVLHQVFQVAVDDGMIRQNPTDNMLKELKLSHGFEREKKEALTVAQQKLFFDYMLSHPKSAAGSPHILSRKVSFGMTVTASGFFISEPSLANILLKDTPTEIVSPSSNLIVSRMSFATFSGEPKMFSVPLTSNQHSSIP